MSHIVGYNRGEPDRTHMSYVRLSALSALATFPKSLAKSCTRSADLCGGQCLYIPGPEFRLSGRQIRKIIYGTCV